jgi:hypothetical protein
VGGFVNIFPELGSFDKCPYFTYKRVVLKKIIKKGIFDKDPNNNGYYVRWIRRDVADEGALHRQGFASAFV